ncbi:hypothetical protein CTI12_AA611720 [Artemisia annua]|uniref:Uncharacterized protein n=1 Tax=Artemisia annua TaxID=35608 RepID=A0A2U1KEF4_ARTAN|nr:hypothetical protein CTI12_AA611720 [Artemisia annua]
MKNLKPTVSELKRGRDAIASYSLGCSCGRDSSKHYKFRILVVYLTKLFGLDMVLPMNIGAEGVEATIKHTWQLSIDRVFAVWGGASTFNQLMRYAHKEVTYSSHAPSNPHDSHRVMLNIFDVRTGRVMGDFKGSADKFAFGGIGGFTGASWPGFRWGGGK